MRMIDYFNRLSIPWFIAIGIFLNLLVGTFDYVTGSQISLTLFYLIPVSFVTWFVNRKSGYIMSFIAIATIPFILHLQESSIKTIVEVWNLALVFGFFVIITYLLSYLKESVERISQYSKELEQNNKELNNFTSIAAHDLRAPLRAISGFAGLLQKHYKNKLDAEAEEYISYIVDGTERMNQLINNLLEYARVGTRKISLVPEDCNIILEKTLANLMLEITESGAVITAASLPTVSGDSTQLIQLFQNLIGNAIKYSNKTPHIHISAERKNGEWLFRVSDNGIGIDSNQFQRIFEIFQRLHTRDQYSGTGIGLAICKKIVERHGGRIWVESETDKGSSFLFTLPAETLQPNQ